MTPRHLLARPLAALVVGAASLVGLSVSAAPAHAQDAERSFAFAYGGETPELARRAELRLPDWTAGLGETLATATPWDASQLGPVDVVARRASYHLELPAPGIARLRISVPQALGLRSAEDSARALGDAAARQLELHVRDLAIQLQDRLRLRTQDQLTSVHLSLATLDEELAAIETRYGDPQLERDIVSTRLQRVESDSADARVDVAVVTRQLATARAAVQRAASVLELQDEVDRYAARADAQPDGLATLVARLRAAQSSGPTLDTARDRVFSLEVLLVGSESRVAHLEGEVEPLRERQIELLRGAREHESVRARRDLATRRLREFEDESAAQERRFAVPVFEIVRPVGLVRDR